MDYFKVLTVCRCESFKNVDGANGSFWGLLWEYKKRKLRFCSQLKIVN